MHGTWCTNRKEKAGDESNEDGKRKEINDRKYMNQNKIYILTIFQLLIVNQELKKNINNL